jgi:hypothetical protein
MENFKLKVAPASQRVYVLMRFQAPIEVAEFENGKTDFE